MTLYGLTCGYWTDDLDERNQHYRDHRAIGAELAQPVFLDEHGLNGATPPVLRGCAQDVKLTAKKRAAANKARPPEPEGVITAPEDYLVRSWLNAEATHLHGGVEPVAAPIPEPHPNEIATRQAAEAGLYPVVHDEDGNEIDPLTVVGAHDARNG